jgi:hypothetical protein
MCDVKAENILKNTIKIWELSCNDVNKTEQQRIVDFYVDGEVASVSISENF